MEFVQGGFLIQFVLTWEASWQWQVKITCLIALWTFLVPKMAMKIFAIFDDFSSASHLAPFGIYFEKKNTFLDNEKIYSNYINGNF